MTTDRDVEGMLADWLEEEAAPIPDHLLAKIVDTPSRHAQLGASGSLGGALGRSLLAVAAAAVLLLAVVTGPTLLDRLSALVGSLLRPEPMTWDAALDFRTLTEARNPSPDRHGNADVWSYLHGADGDHDPDDYLKLVDHRAIGPKNWYDRGYVNLFVGAAPGEDRLTMHPWGGAEDIRAAILAWRSPIAGEVTVTGTVEVDATCGDGVIFSLDRGPDGLERIPVAFGSREFSVTTPIRIGESLYFHVEPGTDATCDTTWLTLRIEG